MTATVVLLKTYITEREEQERIDRLNQEANSYFAKATPRQHAEFAAAMHSLLGCVGPKWDRARKSAHAKFKADTKEAATLCDRTFECLLETGEVSEELDALWTALIDRETVGAMMAAE